VVPTDECFCSKCVSRWLIPELTIVLRQVPMEEQRYAARHVEMRDVREAKDSLSGPIVVSIRPYFAIRKFATHDEGHHGNVALSPNTAAHGRSSALGRGLPGFEGHTYDGLSELYSRGLHDQRWMYPLTEWIAESPLAAARDLDHSKPLAVCVDEPDSCEIIQDLYVTHTIVFTVSTSVLPIHRIRSRCGMPWSQETKEWLKSCLRTQPHDETPLRAWFRL